MHLNYLLTKNHFVCEGASGVSPGRIQFQQETCYGVVFAPGADSFLKIAGASEFPHLSRGEDNIGWFAKPLIARRTQSTLRLRFTSASGHSERQITVANGESAPVYLPALLDLPDPFEVADLEIHCSTPPKTPLFLGTSRRVDRSQLLSLAKGSGVEIGPGPKPQIFNSEDTQVLYVEEKLPEQWASSYGNAETDVTSWEASGYRIGKAHDLPVADASLDFIFSSHVFEHLVNPLGHLAHWRKKLKPGGLVLGVVPCLDGTKDLVLPPTTLTQLLEEQSAGQFTIPASHFEHWVKYSWPSERNPAARAQELRDAEFSIHVHVYDNALATAVLREATARLGYDRYRLQYKANSKDFLFALRAGR